LFQVYELPFERFSLVMPLFERAWFDEMFIMPALKGEQPGRVVVDRVDSPTAAILFRTYGFYIAGSPDALGLRQFIKEAPAEVGTFQHFHGFVPIDPAWESVLLDDFSNQLMLLKRCNYRWPGAPLIDWRSLLPDGVSIIPIDAALAQRLDQDWNEVIGLLWSGYDRFERDGYGFCLKVENELASLVATDGVGEGLVNIGVRTAEKFQRRGYARLVCSAFIEHTLTRGLLPVWDCEDRNARSKALAEHLGFVQERPFTELCVSEPPYGKLKLAERAWTGAPAASGTTVWTRS
jgi:RimJ/RimL family protein N-acetyltransferase